MRDSPSSPDATAGRTAAATRTSLPRALSDFLVDLSIALHKHAMYPPGHPALASSGEVVTQRLTALLAGPGQLSLGVARQQLVVEGIATDPRHPVLRELADRLHRQHLGAVQFRQGVEPAELCSVLAAVASDPDRGGSPLGFGPAADLAQWAHIRLFPLTFDRLELVGGPPDSDAAGRGDASVAGGRPAGLWLGLARAALAGGGTDAAAPPEGAPAVGLGGEGVAADPAAVAEAIEAHERGTAYDQAVVGYLLEIADELRGASGASVLGTRMSRLIAALDRTTLRRLLHMGGDLAQRRQFVLDASQGMAVEAVLDLVAAASGEGAPLSAAMLRMLTKLGHHAEHVAPDRRPGAEAELREQIGELVKGWALADPNPDGYALALQRMAAARPAGAAEPDAPSALEPERMLMMACEADAPGPGLERAVDRMVAAARFGPVLDVVDRAPAGSGAAAAIARQVQTPASVRTLLAGQPIDYALLDRVLAPQGPDGADPLLDLLAETESRQARRAVLDRLLRLGGDLGPRLLARLGDERWYVVRNVLFVAAEMPNPPLGLRAGAFRHHADPRVRREAYRLLLRDPAERTRSLCTALSDPAPALQRLALAAAAEGGCPAAAVPLVINLASDRDLESDVRVAAIRVLAAHGGPLALEALLRLTEIRRRRSLVEAVKGAGASAAFLSALSALASFLDDRRARERLLAASRLRDPAVQKVASAALRGA